MAVEQLTRRRALFGGALGLAAVATGAALPALARDGRPQAEASETLRVAAWAWIQRFEARGGTLHVAADGKTVWMGAALPSDINLPQVQREIAGPLREEILRQVRVEHRAGLRGAA